MKSNYLDYILEETYLSFKKGGLLNVISIGTITITLFIFGVFLLLTQNLQLMLLQWKADIHLIVFFKDVDSAKKYLEFADDLRKQPGIQSVTYVSREHAREFMVAKGYGFLLDHLEENPLPASLEISFDLDVLSSSDIRDRIDRIKLDKIVESVSYGGGFFESLSTTIWVLKTLGIFLVIIYALASVFIIGTTIRLTYFSRQDEIAIMRLVGATSWFVRWPYLLGGMLQGLIGSILAVVLLFILYHVLSARLDFSAMAAFGLHKVVFFEPITILFMVLGGVIVGCMGSIISIRKIIRL